MSKTQKYDKFDSVPEYEWPEGFIPALDSDQEGKWTFGSESQPGGACDLADDAIGKKGVHEEQCCPKREMYDVSDPQSSDASCSNDDEQEDSRSAWLLGRRGEDAAAMVLERKGYEILERNWRCPAGEADIIAYDEDGCLVFVEVKTRSGAGKGMPEEAVDAKKRARYEAIASFYLSDFEGDDCQVRFDVVSILALPNSRALVRHLVNAFSVGL